MNFKTLTKYLLLWAFIPALLLSSCTDEDEIITPSADQTFGIRHDKSLSEYESAGANEGSYTTTAYPDFSSVVHFNYSIDGSNQRDYVASGTLISNQWVLTAGHNFYVAEEQKTPAPAAGVRVLVGNDPNNPSATYEVEELVFHPTWLDQGDGFVNGNDLCLVKLKTPITNVTVAPLYTSSTETIGSGVWFCGYGDYSQVQGQNADALSKKHALENILDRKNSGISTTNGNTTYTGGLLAFDFDNPEETINSLGDDLVNEDEDRLGAGTSDATCQILEGTTITGDSGGPLFVKDGSTWKVAGVLSGGAAEPIANHQDSNYGDISIFTRVFTAIDWINTVVQ